MRTGAKEEKSGLAGEFGLADGTSLSRLKPIRDCPYNLRLRLRRLSYILYSNNTLELLSSHHILC